MALSVNTTRIFRFLLSAPGSDVKNGTKKAGIWRHFTWPGNSLMTGNNHCDWQGRVSASSRPPFLRARPVFPLSDADGRGIFGASKWWYWRPGGIRMMGDETHRDTLLFILTTNLNVSLWVVCASRNLDTREPCTWTTCTTRNVYTFTSGISAQGLPCYLIYFWNACLRDIRVEFVQCVLGSLDLSVCVACWLCTSPVGTGVRPGE